MSVCLLGTVLFPGCNRVTTQSSSEPADRNSAKASLTQRAARAAESVADRIVDRVMGPQPQEPQGKPSVKPPVEVPRRPAARRHSAAMTRSVPAEATTATPTSDPTPTPVPSPELLEPPPTVSPAVTIPALLPNSTVFLIDGSPVFLLPDRTRIPLRLLSKTSVVKFLDAEGAWYHVTFQDSPLGTRYGYVEARFVDLSHTPLDLDLRSNAAASEAGERAPTSEPQDLSVRPRADEPVDVPVPGTRPDDPVDLSVRPHDR